MNNETGHRGLVEYVAIVAACGLGIIGVSAAMSSFPDRQYYASLNSTGNETGQLTGANEGPIDINAIGVGALALGTAGAITIFGRRKWDWLNSDPAFSNVE